MSDWLHIESSLFFPVSERHMTEEKMIDLLKGFCSDLEIEYDEDIITFFNTVPSYQDKDVQMPSQFSFRIMERNPQCEETEQVIVAFERFIKSVCDVCFFLNSYTATIYGSYTDSVSIVSQFHEDNLLRVISLPRTKGDFNE